MSVDIIHLAKLSRLNLSKQEEEKFKVQMQSILEMVEKLPDITSAGAIIDPNNKMILRTDEAEHNFKREELLKNAPAVKAGCIEVPKVVE
ncbi:MAG: Asp-tRNA(Asn)/Glu-tRNA(Gln) amidotransferase subunit GatC [Oscillospiraceae bacterium]